MAATPMRVGVIGVGSMGQNHVRVYSEIAEIVGIADPDVKAGGIVSNRFNVSYFTSAADLLREELDAVSVCVPTEHHAKVALDVIQAGIPLLVEKPLAATAEEASKVVDAAKSAGVTLAVGHIERHNPAIAAVKRHLQEGQYGDLVTATARRVSSFPGRVRDIGVVMDLGVHEIDVLRFLVGAPVESVFALGGRKLHGNFEDHANVLLRFHNGVHGFIEVNWLTPILDLPEKLRRGRLHGAIGHREFQHPRPAGPVQPLPDSARAPPAEDPRAEGGTSAPGARGLPQRDPGEALPSGLRGGCRGDAPRRDRRQRVPSNGKARAAHLNARRIQNWPFPIPRYTKPAFTTSGPANTFRPSTMTARRIVLLRALRSSLRYASCAVTTATQSVPRTAAFRSRTIV
ncbi:MAG: hypothetical protein E6K00_00180 [Methanobacteriota archaeon]|nr:MAG: hypothetical protein E6K00_00180 [Euryarchaeota archaeon]